MRTQGLILILLAVSQLAAAPAATSQETPAGDAELAALERQAEDRFAEDDLEAASGLYRRLANRMRERREKTRVLIIVAYLEHLQARDPAAVRTIRDALVEDPDYAFRREHYGDTFAGLFYEAQKQAAELRGSLAELHLRQGTERFRRQDYGAARREYETALGYRGDHPEAIYNLALTNLHDGREEPAEAGFQKLLALGERVGSGTRALALTNLGYIYERRRQYQEAEGFLEEAVALDPSNAQAWSILGASRRQLGKASAAAEAFRRVYDLTPGDSQAMSNLALVHIDAGNFAPAVALLEQATAADPDGANHWLSLGRARQGAGDDAGAVAAFENAVRLDPTDAGGWASNAATHLSLHYYQAGDFRRALEQADRALTLREDLITARIYQGLARESLGDLGGARESLEQARRLDPARADTHNNLGSVYFQLGLYDQATEAFERALAIQPDFPGARANLDAVREGRVRPNHSPPPSGGDARPVPPAAGTGPSLGLGFADIDYAALGLKGAMVERVVSGGAADRAGVRKSDLILKIDGRDVSDAAALERYVASRPPGSTVTLSLLRDNVPKRIDVRLSSVPKS